MVVLASSPVFLQKMSPLMISGHPSLPVWVTNPYVCLFVCLRGGYPIAKAGPELLILLPQRSQCWDDGCVLHLALLCSLLIKTSVTSCWD